MADENQITVFAKTNFRNREVPFGIKTDDRRRHMYVIGKTGMGKTTLMENMAIQDIRNGHGVAFLDPHGDSVQKILDNIPSSRINDVIYFNPADMEHPIAFNILEAVDPKYKHLVASGLMGVFTKIWANLWSARMEYILNNTIMALLDSPGNTMLGITRMYVDKKYRKKIVDNIKDPMIRAFWVDEFANYNEKYRTEAIAPIQNKVGQFLSNSIIRNIVGQPKSTIDLRELMDQQKILIMDLSKGKVGEDNSALLGAMLVTKLQLAAMSRTDIPEKERKDFYMYVDEFQNFATESFATILSEARKYRLNLTVGHQYIAQLEQDKNTKVRDAIFGNVGTMVVFRVGAADAEFMETEFDPTFTPTDLVNLPKYNIILRLMINGVASEPFSATTLPPHPDWFSGNGEKIIKVSRERYSNTVAEVEERISRWMGAEFHQEAAVVIGQPSERRESSPDIELAPLVEEKSQERIQVRNQVQSLEQPLETVSLPQMNLPAEPVVQPPPVPQKDPDFSVAPVTRNVPVPKFTPPAPVQQKNHPPRQENHSRSDSQDYNRSSRHQSSFRSAGHHGQASRGPVRGNRPEQKKQNPIWETVATMHSQKMNEQQQRITQVVTNILKNSPVPPKKAEVERQAVPPVQEKPVQKAPEAPKPEAQPERKVLKPGQTHTF